MAAVRSFQNKSTELRLIALFRHHRITGWRRHYPLFGSPDFTFPKLKLALFVDGCFWHACPSMAPSPPPTAPSGAPNSAATAPATASSPAASAPQAGASPASGNTT